MKIFFSTIILITALNCGSSQNDLTKNEEPPLSRTTEQDDILVGKVELQDFKNGPHADWFEPMYQSYNPNEESVAIIKENIDDYTIKAFMGTWCGDSRREIPKLYKLLEMANYDLSKLEMVAVTRDKTTPGDLQEGYDVQYVPTIIFFKNGEEVDRFVEYSQEEFEQDIAKIVSGEDYKDPYE